MTVYKLYKNINTNVKLNVCKKCLRNLNYKFNSLTGPLD